MTQIFVKKDTPNGNIIGWRERVALPLLGVSSITAKTDTGAFSSSIHAFNIEPTERNGELWVSFSVLPSRHDPELVVRCEALVSGHRKVKSSDGSSGERYFIQTELLIGGRQLNIEMSLADRRNMGYRMLLGRAAIKGNFIVDAAGSYLAGRPKKT